MKALISCVMTGNIHDMWEELQKTESLKKVAAPILYFRSMNGDVLPEKWEAGQEYFLNLYAYNFIPLGKHIIDVKLMDAKNKVMFTHEHGLLAKTWNHRICVKSLNYTSFQYEDEIEIRAGLLTILIWAFAHVFYRHRQRKWRKILLENNQPL